MVPQGIYEENDKNENKIHALSVVVFHFYFLTTDRAMILGFQAVLQRQYMPVYKDISASACRAFFSEQGWKQQACSGAM